MANSDDWAFPASLQPRPSGLRYDLVAAMNAVMSLRAEVPEDAFTASILGTERTGNGIVIRDDGLVLTIGYLITEASTIWLTANDGRVVQGYPLAYDFASGFGLVQPLGRLGIAPLLRGSIDTVNVDDDVCVLSHGGRVHALQARVFDKREFAGYWEYVLDEALFTSPPHPEWSGAALVGEDGRLVGVGSLFVQEAVGDESIRGNMFVPIDLLEPVLDDMVRFGRPSRPPRPWLGMYPVDSESKLVVNGLAKGGPAAKAGIRTGDHVLAVAGARVEGLADLFRKVWKLGPAGTEIPLTLVRDGAPRDVLVRSADRASFLKKPSLQ